MRVTTNQHVFCEPHICVFFLATYCLRVDRPDDLTALQHLGEAPRERYRLVRSSCIFCPLITVSFCVIDADVQQALDIFTNLMKHGEARRKSTVKSK